jgi:glycosyltransferase involved in cell wall biosynthesis
MNNPAGLERTLISVFSQTAPGVEVIVVDGGPGDDTEGIEKAFSDQLARWIGEPDKGPYDAMNKGAAAATGDYILFMNSGDVFFNEDVVEKLLDATGKGDADAVYGDSIADYGAFAVYRRAGHFSGIWKGMIFSHQALLMRTRLVKEYRFDLSAGKIADYDLVVRSLGRSAAVRQIDTPVAVCDAYGISNRGRSAIRMGYYRVAGKYLKLAFSQKLHHILSWLFLLLLDLASALIPQKAYLALVNLFRGKKKSKTISALCKY